MERICSIEDCTRPAVARTWCRAHWKHWRRWGDPEFFQTERAKVPPLDRFMAKVDQSSGPNGCWLWTASRDPLGYGFFRMTPGETMWRAHRAAWTLLVGPIPAGLVVCHHCDNPPCVNPAHLFLGTDADNCADRVAKGRSSRRVSHRGETSPLAKLTEQDVREIRERYARGGIYQRELGVEYGVSQTEVGRIVRGVRWRQADQAGSATA